MGLRSATELLRLPVQLRGIGLGRPVDLLLDRSAWRVFGFVVLCGDESERFLPYSAAEPREDEISVPSALPLLEDVEFYRGRSRSFRALLGASVVCEGHELGGLRDLRLTSNGTVESLLVEQGGDVRDVEPAGARIDCVSAA